MIQAIAFDFGGTLFSTAKMGVFTPPMVDAFVEHVIRELTCSRELGEQIFQAYTKAWKVRRARGSDLPEKETSSLDLLRAALIEVHVKLSVHQMIEVLNAFHAKESEQFIPLPTVTKTLPVLALKGYRLSIVSNNPWTESIGASLRRHSLDSLFEKVIVSCDVGFRKPSRQIFEELFRGLNLPTSNILFVGDSFTHDIEIPKEMGFKTCLVDFEGTNKNSQREHSGDADLFLTQFDQLVMALNTLT